MLVAKGRGDMIRASEKLMARRGKFPFERGKPTLQLDTIFGRQQLHEMGFRTPSGRMVGNDGRSLDWHRKHGTDGSRVSWKQQRKVAPNVTSANPTELKKSNVIQGPWKASRRLRATRAAGAFAQSLQPRSKLSAGIAGAAAGVIGMNAIQVGSEYRRDPKAFRQAFRDQAERDRKNKQRWRENRTSLRQRMREISEQNAQVAAGVGKSMPNMNFTAGDVAKSSNVREYEYLPEWVRESFAPGPALRPVLNPLNLYASGRLMVESAATADGRRLSRRKKRKLANAERQFAQGRMMLYSPLGRGSVVYE